MSPEVATTSMAEVARTSMADFGDDEWPPGCRFHPTDEELVQYYLKRKICRRNLRIDVIAEVDVYKFDPEDLPALSLVRNGVRQWYFFSPRDWKYPNGSRSNRATGHGYWKATGKDRHICCNSLSVGLKKTLVFYKGRAPSGERTDWVMHEYTIEESELRRCQDVQDHYALCKVYKKSGMGPKNGEHYGTPIIEDWIDDDLPEVSNYNDANNHVKQSNCIESVDMHNDTQVQRPSDDIEELLKQFIDSPDPVGSDINGYGCGMLQAFGEEVHGSMMGPSSVHPCRIHHPGQQNTEGTMELTLPSTSQVQFQDAWNLAPTGLINLEQHLREQDFLEIDELCPETVDLGGELIQQPSTEPTTNILQWGEVDGLSELDLYYDAETFLREFCPINDDAAPHSYTDFQATQMVNLDDLERKQPSNAMNTGDMFAGNFTPKAMESNSNRSGKGVEGNDKWYSSSSALWSYVESIPTTPASASESALVNRAFDRMPSFTQLRLNPESTTSGSTGGRMKEFLLFSFSGAFFAVLFLFITTLGKIMLSLQIVK